MVQSTSEFNKKLIFNEIYTFKDKEFSKNISKWHYAERTVYFNFKFTVVVVTKPQYVKGETNIKSISVYGFYPHFIIFPGKILM